MKDITKYLSLISVVTALLLFLYVQACIRASDIALTYLFLIGWFIEFGVTWRHRKWGAQIEPSKERTRWWLSKMYWTATVLTVIIPPLSLGAAYVLRVEAAQHIDGAIAAMMLPTPPTVAVTKLKDVTVPGSSVPGVYLAVFKPPIEEISPAASVLQLALRDVDKEWRSSVAWWIWLAIVCVLIGLFWSEMFADMHMGGGALAAGPATMNESPILGTASSPNRTG